MKQVIAYTLCKLEEKIQTMDTESDYTDTDDT